MTKNKKKLWLVVCILVLFTICVAVFAGCSQGGKKYDVAIRIGCSDGSVYEFPVGTDELHIEIPYDGVERKYEVLAYNYPDHPTWSEHWISPNFESPNGFSVHIIYGYDENGSYEAKSLFTQGKYRISIEADSTSDYLWIYRKVYLYVTVL